MTAQLVNGVAKSSVVPAGWYMALAPYGNRPCYICGRPDVCEHREPELLTAVWRRRKNLQKPQPQQ